MSEQKTSTSGSPRQGRRRNTGSRGGYKRNSNTRNGGSDTSRNTSRARPARGRARASTSARGGEKRSTTQQKGKRHAPRRLREPEKKSMVQRTSSTKDSVQIPPAGDNVRVVPLGGVEEVGKNMIAIEYGGDIVVADMGFQFVEEESPGIDYLLPNTKYLEDNKDKIRGVIITHGHLDHIGGIPYILPRIGNPPIYTRAMTALMIKKRQTEFLHMPSPTIHEVEMGKRQKLGNLTVGFFGVTHSIPDSMGMYVETPMGNVVLSGDLRIDHVNGEPEEHEKKNWGEIGKMNNLLFITDSTNAENPGFSITEREIRETLEQIIIDTPDRLIIGTFASQFARLIRIIELGAKHGRKVIAEGRSIKTNIEIAKEAGILKPDTAKNIIPIEEIQNYPPNKILVLATGAQGEEFAALMRMGNKKHRHITLSSKDTIVLSSSVIPGNEINVQRLKDNLYRHGVKIIHYRVSDVHASGHGNAEELAWIDEQVKARFYMPGYGYHSMVRVHGQIIEENKIAPKENIIIADNGNIIDFMDGGKKFVIQKEKVPASDMVVDGLSIGDIQHVVLRDRQTLGQEGILVFIAIVDLKTGKLKKSPDIITRGFVYIRESQELIRETRGLVKKAIENTIVGMHPINFDYVKDKAADDVARFLLQKTAKRPIVIPVISGI